MIGHAIETLHTKFDLKKMIIKNVLKEIKRRKTKYLG